MTTPVPGPGRKVVISRVDPAAVALVCVGALTLPLAVASVVVTAPALGPSWLAPAPALWCLVSGLLNCVKEEAFEVRDETPVEGPTA